MLIVSGDEIFARMVLRVLENAGYRPVSVSARKSGFFERAVVDLDTVTSPKLGERCITVSASPAKGADLTRPFLTDSLLLLASRTFGDIPAPADPVSCESGADSDLSDGSGLPEENQPSAPSAPPELTEEGVIVDGHVVLLSPKERALYALLLARRGQTVDKAEISRAIFADAPGNNPEVYVSYLRAKLDYVVGRRIIRTVRGKGYVIE